MQINTNITFEAVRESSAALGIERKIVGLQVAQAVETQDLKLLQAAIAACARREVSRRSAKTGATSKEAVRAEAKAEKLRDLEIEIEAKADSATDVLRLMR